MVQVDFHRAYLDEDTMCYRVMSGPHTLGYVVRRKGAGTLWYVYAQERGQRGRLLCRVYGNRDMAARELQRRIR